MLSPVLPHAFIQQDGEVRGLAQWRKALEQQLEQALHHGKYIRRIIAMRAQAIDHALQLLWQRHQMPEQQIALFAVGGYGRGEMLPFSDVDLLILSVEDLDPTVEEKIMGLDLYKFERIMLNLISNAIKFSNDDGIIFIDLIDKDTSVEISVKDQGIGIDRDNLENIFNKFKQEDKSLNRNTEGTGIGLSLVKSMVELHEGRIDVESTLNVGTKFTINLPVKIIEETVIVDSDYNAEDRVEMIKFELSDIYD